MKLSYFHGDVVNFGDELNPWLWGQLLGDLLDSNDDELFLGIGSILHSQYPAEAKKIVFGSGYGGYKPPPVLDDSWQVYFVRGPKTAEVLGLPGHRAIGDAATLIRTLPPLATTRSSSVAFMPHWESAVDGSWEEVARDAGVEFVDPRWDVERILIAIGSASLLVTEAMHGAIVADALRTPWVPFAPISRQHHYKWQDWAATLDLEIEFEPSASSTWFEFVVRQFSSASTTRNGSSTIAGLMGTCSQAICSERVRSRPSSGPHVPSLVSARTERSAE